MAHNSEKLVAPHAPSAIDTDAADDNEHELRAFLRTRLPEHMVPAAFVFLDALPLTSSGKVDRRALPAPALAGEPQFAASERRSPEARARSGYVAPRGELEKRVAAICADVLRIARVGADDNFFALGGHSLLVTRVVSKLRNELGVDVPARLFFEHPTVRGLARALEALRPHARELPDWLWRLSAGRAGQTPVFFVHGGGGSASVYAHLAQQLDDAPFYGISAPEHEDSVEAMAASYVQAMRGVQPRGPYVVGGWSLGGVLAFEMARQLERAGESALLILLDAFAPGDSAPDELVLLAEFAEGLGVPWQALHLDPARVVALAGPARWDYVAASAHAAGVALPTFEGPAQLERLFARFARLARMQTGYALAPIAAPTLLVRATVDASPDDPGWDPGLTGPVTVVPLAADHYRMLEPPAVVALGRVLREHLAAHRA